MTRSRLTGQVSRVTENRLWTTLWFKFRQFFRLLSIQANPNLFVVLFLSLISLSNPPLGFELCEGFWYYVQLGCVVFVLVCLVFWSVFIIQVSTPGQQQKKKNTVQAHPANRVGSRPALIHDQRAARCIMRSRLSLFHGRSSTEWTVLIVLEVVELIGEHPYQALWWQRRHHHLLELARLAAHFRAQTQQPLDL